MRLREERGERFRRGLGERERDISDVVGDLPRSSPRLIDLLRSRSLPSLRGGGERERLGV